ncbi:zinc ribbon-containing protein [Vibrio sp. S11_S32]|uniref:zinc ribbon-containing protein n=1 Tax=Vibrio sp. S11_S32 TaxID=2720225 RepID=UPI001681C07B|nr:zinc ribbon-containing protein [Vibrio sp. S11_S32]MBD1575021.1 zinc ribbon-containing protein [Vibrio sp. S11_S32]
MPKRQQEYKQVLEQLLERVKKTPEELEKALETPKEMLDAVKDMTKDEMALIQQYLKSDLKEFSDSYQKSQEDEDDPFMTVVAESIWEGLLEITDRTQVEWREVFKDIEHKGLYEVGDIIGLGALVCEKCGHRQEYTHPHEITPCMQCGNHAFTRMPLKP